MKGVLTTIALSIAALVFAPSAQAASKPCMQVWQAAPAGHKYEARKECLNNLQVARVTRACIQMRSGMGSRVCRAIAMVRPAWATNAAYHDLIGRESGYDPNAVNDNSDACGLGQRLVSGDAIHPRGGRGCPWAFKVVGYRGHHRVERVYATPLAQTKDVVSYISGRYGTPEAAISHHNSVGWY